MMSILINKSYYSYTTLNSKSVIKFDLVNLWLSPLPQMRMNCTSPTGNLHEIIIKEVWIENASKVMKCAKQVTRELQTRRRKIRTHVMIAPSVLHSKMNEPMKSKLSRYVGQHQTQRLRSEP